MVDHSATDELNSNFPLAFCDTGLNICGFFYAIQYIKTVMLRTNNLLYPRCRQG